MDRALIEERVRETIGVVLRREQPVPADFGRSAQSEWDSLKHAEILFAIEEEFQVRFSETDLEQLDSVPRLVARLEELSES